MKYKSSTVSFSSHCFSSLPQCVRLHLSIPYRLLLGNVGCSTSTFYFSSLKSLGCTKIVIFHQFFSSVRRIRQTYSPLPSSPCVTQAFVIIARQQRSQPQPSWGQGRTGADVISFLNVSQWWAICFPSSFTNSSLTTVFFFFVQAHLWCIRVRLTTDGFHETDF